MPTFADLLRTYREQRRLPQRTVSQTSGVNQALISRFETGDRLPSGPEQVLAMSDALRLAPEEADALLAAAGYWPRVYVALGPGDPTLLTVAQVLASTHLAGERKDRFRQLIALLAAEWTAA